MSEIQRTNYDPALAVRIKDAEAAVVEACIREAEAFDAWRSIRMSNPATVGAFALFAAAKKDREAAVRALREVRS